MDLIEVRKGFALPKLVGITSQDTIFAEENTVIHQPTDFSGSILIYEEGAISAPYGDNHLVVKKGAASPVIYRRLKV